MRSKAKNGSLFVPSVVDSEEVGISEKRLQPNSLTCSVQIKSHAVKHQIVPFEKSLTLATYSEADPTTIRKVNFRLWRKT